MQFTKTVPICSAVTNRSVIQSQISGFSQIFIFCVANCSAIEYLIFLLQFVASLMTSIQGILYENKNQSHDIAYIFQSQHQSFHSFSFLSFPFSFFLFFSFSFPFPPFLSLGGCLSSGIER